MGQALRPVTIATLIGEDTVSAAPCQEVKVRLAMCRFRITAKRLVIREAIRRLLCRQELRPSPSRRGVVVVVLDYRVDMFLEPVVGVVTQQELWL